MRASHPFGQTFRSAADQLATVEHPDPVPVLVPHARLAFEGFSKTGKMFFQRRTRRDQIVRVCVLHPGGDADGSELVQGVANQLGPAFVKTGLAGLHVPLPGTHASAPQNVGQALALLGKLLFRYFSGGDVAVRNDGTLHAQAHRAHTHGKPEQSLWSRARKFKVETGQMPFEDRHNAVPGIACIVAGTRAYLQVIGPDVRGGGRLTWLQAVVPRKLLPSCIDRQDGAGVVYHRDLAWHRVQHVLCEGLAFMQRLHSLQALRHIVNIAMPQRAAVGLADRGGLAFHPQHVPRRVIHAIALVPQRQRVCRALNRSPDAYQVVRVKHLKDAVCVMRCGFWTHPVNGFNARAGVGEDGGAIGHELVLIDKTGQMRGQHLQSVQQVVDCVFGLLALGHVA